MNLFFSNIYFIPFNLLQCFKFSNSPFFFFNMIQTTDRFIVVILREKAI